MSGQPETPSGPKKIVREIRINPIVPTPVGAGRHGTQHAAEEGRSARAA